METTYAFLKQNGLLAAALPVLLYLQFSTGAEIRDLRAEIRAELERNGKTLGVNDLHIAGHARSEGLTLVSNNLKEFDRVAGLRLENWA